MYPVQTTGKGWCAQRLSMAKVLSSSPRHDSKKSDDEQPVTVEAFESGVGHSIRILLTRIEVCNLSLTT